MKNKLTDLNNHLFAQLERLSDESASAESIEREIQRAEAIVKVSNQIIETADVSLRAAKIMVEYGADPSKLLPSSVSESAPELPKEH
jgi:hypothetical protein